MLCQKITNHKPPFWFVLDVDIKSSKVLHKCIDNEESLLTVLCGFQLIRMRVRKEGKREEGKLSGFDGGISSWLQFGLWLLLCGCVLLERVALRVWQIFADGGQDARHHWECWECWMPFHTDLYLLGVCLCGCVRMCSS